MLSETALNETGSKPAGTGPPAGTPVACATVVEDEREVGAAVVPVVLGAAVVVKVVLVAAAAADVAVLPEL